MESALLDLTITGMTCAACARNVTRALDSIAGAGASRVNLNSRRARVRYPATREAIAQLVAAVEEAGYGASPAKPESVGGSIA